MSSVYDADVLSAREMIAEAGFLTRVRRVGATPYNPLLGPEAEPAAAEGDIYLVVLPVTPGLTESFDQRVLVRTRNRQIFAAFPPTEEWELRPGDEVYFGEQWWPVGGVAPLNPDDSATAILYQGEVAHP